MLSVTRLAPTQLLYDLPSPWVAYDEQNKRLLETPQLSAPAQPATLNRERAAAMHKELAKLGFATAQHYKLASRVLGRDVTSFTALTEAEALAVWNACRREASRITVSDEEAQAVLN